MDNTHILNDDMENKQKKIAYSAVQPTGYPTLGNYIGAIRNWPSFQDNHNCLFCIADLHSLTVRQEPALIRKKTLDLFMLYIAAGLDPEKCILYIQSHVPQHAELAWILNCYTYTGELNRMTQFKEKSSKNADNINAGLFTYPVLMSADILLYGTDVVPVGEDQKQHVEICRDIAQRFNNIYGEVFKIPEPVVRKEGARIMSLQEPTSKMSKSESTNMNNVIFMLDDPKLIMSKIKKAVTDSDGEIKISPDKPGIYNLLTIYSAMKNITVAEAEKYFAGKNYGTLKNEIGEAVISVLEPIQNEFKRLSTDKAYINEILIKNTHRAKGIADKTIKKVYKKVGLYTT